LLLVVLGLVVCGALPMLVRDSGPCIAQGPRANYGAVSLVAGGPERPADAGGDCCFNLLGDTTWNGVVTWHDVHIVSVAYYASKGDDRYDWRADVDCSGTIDTLDLQLVLMQLCGRTE